MLVVTELATVIDCKADPSTTTFAVLETEPSVAVMIAVPADCPVA